MKLKIVLTASGYCLIIGAATYVSWEHGLGAAALLGTLHGLITLLKKHGEVIVTPSQAAPSKKQKVTKSSTKSAPTKDDIAEIAGFNKDVFKQFQNNLQDHQRAPQSKALVADAAKPPLSPRKEKSAHPYAHAATDSKSESSFNETLALEQEDKVSLTRKKTNPDPVKKETPSSQQAASSSSAEKEVLPASEKRETSEAQSPPPSEIQPPVDKNEELLKTLSQPLEEVNEDLFADVQITLPSEKIRPSEKPPTENKKPVDLFDEGLGDTLQADHSQEEKAAEAAALLKMAQAAFQAGQVSETKAGLDNYFSLQQELGALPPWEVQYLYAQVCLTLGDKSQAISRFSEITQEGLHTTHPDYARILESITSSLEEYQMSEDVLPFLYELLNYYRQQLDRAQMDRVYERLERVLEGLEDDEHLIRTYKNHLEIKRILKDQYGESQLLDALGNRYYKMGDKELSRKYYEENLHLKALMNKVESP